jgi:hypothetical protein
MGFYFERNLRKKSHGSISGGPDLSVNLKAQVCIFSQKRGKIQNLNFLPSVLTMWQQKLKMV